jgi:hypothetical protein
MTPGAGTSDVPPCQMKPRRLWFCGAYRQGPCNKVSQHRDRPLATPSDWDRVRQRKLLYALHSVQRLPTGAGWDYVI